ncbi:putative nadh-ubiquinone oxidoreductase [Lyophyllum shimeji]|uniref:Nadh-ubiquinone oxidoreductase n=1 Tax=Lyophyllum shimeji TaxID=47721 RepID=A0A9P3UL74_LYOSH|nr:putative nadh-ubiquinone oxidoreductase [Lyophyllum shimeji]
MSGKKAADAALYHLSPKGFWKKFRDMVVVNPEISSGLPIQSINRRPPPAWRPEKYSTPATKASDPAQNPYWRRDVRRQYPQLSVVTQPELSLLLLEHSGNLPLAPPTEETPGVPATAAAAVDLTEAISTITIANKVYTESKLPPSIPTHHKRWVPERAADAPHDPHSYFPMDLYK